MSSFIRDVIFFFSACTCLCIFLDLKYDTLELHKSEEKTAAFSFSVYLNILRFSKRLPKFEMRIISKSVYQ